MNPLQPRANDTGLPYDGPAVMVVAAGDMDPLYRRLGPLPWTALVHLALNAARTDNTWSAPIGVRALAAGIGVTKDTAARAVRSLAAAGLVSRDRIATTGGARRSGYRLNLPNSIRLIPRRPEPDDQPSQPSDCPEAEETPTESKGTLGEGPSEPPSGHGQPDCPQIPKIPPVSWDQPELFATTPIRTAAIATASNGRCR